MALRSVITIDVDDKAFQRFTAQFQKYQAQVGTTSNAWKTLNLTINNTVNQANRFASAIGSSNQTLGRTTSYANGLSSAFSRLAKDSSTFTKNIQDATVSLLRWASITGLITGIMGLGGLFGIDRLALSTGLQRREAQGLGTTIGRNKSLGITLDRLINTDALQSGVSQALSSPYGRIPLGALGLDYNTESKRDTSDVSIDVIRQLKKFVDQNPQELMSTLIPARHLDELGFTAEDARRLRATPNSEVEKYISDYQKNSRSLGLADQTAQAWQNLNVQLRLSGETLKNVFVNGLVSWTGPLEHISEGLTHLAEAFFKNASIREDLDAFGGTLNHVAKLIATEDFSHAFDSFATSVGRMAKLFADSLPSIETGIGFIESFFNGLQTIADWLNWFTNLNLGKKLGDMLGTTSIVPGLKGSKEEYEHIRSKLFTEGLQQGYTPQQIAGIAGNIQAESTWDPTAKNESGHRGLAQWDTERWAQATAFYGHQPNADEQVDWIFRELKSNPRFADTDKQLRAAGNPNDAARIVNEGYEVSGTPSYGRQMAADVQYGQFKDRSIRVEVINKSDANVSVSPMLGVPGPQ